MLRRLLFILLIALILLASTVGSLRAVIGPAPEPQRELLGTTPPFEPSKLFAPLISCADRPLYSGDPPFVTMPADWDQTKDQTEQEPYLTRIREYTNGDLLFGSQTFVLSTTQGAVDGYQGVIGQPTTAKVISVTFPVTATLYQFSGTLPEYHLFYLDRNIVGDIYGIGVGQGEVVTRAMQVFGLGVTCGY